jgi:hypothetical protein
MLYFSVHTSFKRHLFVHRLVLPFKKSVAYQSREKRASMYFASTFPKVDYSFFHTCSSELYSAGHFHFTRHLKFEKDQEFNSPQISHPVLDEWNRSFHVSLEKDLKRLLHRLKHLKDDEVSSLLCVYCPLLYGTFLFALEKLRMFFMCTSC